MTETLAPVAPVAPVASPNLGRKLVLHNVAQGIFDPIPFRPSFIDRFQDVLHYCEKHQKLAYIERGPAWKNFAKAEGFSEPPACFDCLLKKPPVETKPSGWKGWR